jgi:glyoxylase-like metal-dependent hydrolase (beta-lactamase superfamily II)
MKSKSGHRWIWIVGGAGTAVALYLIAKRFVSDFVAQMESPKPDICQGFASLGSIGDEDVRCVNLGVTTDYLLKGQDGYLLIDTGYARNYDTFIDGLARVGVGLDEIKALLLTHGHDDHAGFAARFLEETGARLIVHRDAVPLLQGEQMTPHGLRFLSPWVFVLVLAYMLVAERDFGYPPVIPGDNDIILDGDNDQVLRDLGFDAEVIATPGHTGDSISVVTSDGRVFCGDAVMNFLSFSGAQLRPIFISDEDEVFVSWRKMLEHGARVIYPAHGTPLAAERLAIALRKFRPQLVPVKDSQ